METNDWDKLSQLDDLKSVIDPHDEKGSKNVLIDVIHWNAFRKHLRHSRNILDFGCGTGRYARRIDAMGKNYLGIATSIGMIRKAIDTNGHKYFKHYDGIRIPFPANNFDTVIVSEVFTYILKTPAGEIALSEINRVLTPHGRLLILEQASISGRKSESANDILTEDDYRHALADRFKIERLYKVRSPDFSALTCKILESPKVPLSMFRLIAPYVAHHETGLVNKASDAYFKTTSYYEFIIEALAVKLN